MLNFAGSPYIDLRVDLNSFLPNDLNESISKKLINYFIKKLKIILQYMTKLNSN